MRLQRSRMRETDTWQASISCAMAAVRPGRDLRKSDGVYGDNLKGQIEDVGNRQTDIEKLD